MIFVEMTAEEMRANRGMLDAIVDATRAIMGSFYGSYMPDHFSFADGEETEENEEEDGERDG